MSDAKRKHSQDRKKEYDRKRRAAAKPPVTAGGEPSVDSKMKTWPIVRAYVPVEDVFRATGFGSAGIIRARPDGKWFSSFFEISLLDEGIQIMFGKDAGDESEHDELLNAIRSQMPPMEPGPAELAARYIWGAYALGLAADYEYDAKMKARYLGLVPMLSGKPAWWLQQFIGPQGLASPGLVRFLEEHPVPDDIPEDKEILVLTQATFACADTKAIRAELSRREPEFNSDSEEEGAEFFTWSREYPKKHWSPLSRLGGRQILGAVEVHDDHVVAESKVLSMTAILIGKLKDAFGDGIRLTETTWKGSEDLIREAQALRDEEENADEEDEEE
jgi:hypothetical protein